jgi:hypothetical protein
MTTNNTSPLSGEGAAPPMRLATVKEACGYAKMGHTKLYEKINQGAIDAYKRDGRTLIDLNSIDAMNARELVPWKRARRCLRSRARGCPKAR